MFLNKGLVWVFRFSGSHVILFVVVLSAKSEYNFGFGFDDAFEGS